MNHSDDPSCYQDFNRCRTIARRRITQGESITIDATQETARELDTFLDAFQPALHAQSRPMLTELLDHDATMWLSGRPLHGRDAIAAGLPHSAPRSLSNVDWIVGTGRWVALSSANADTSAGPRHLTVLLKVVTGNWQIMYQHVG